MGPYAASLSHFTVATDVLAGHMVSLDAESDAECIQAVSPKAAEAIPRETPHSVSPKAVAPQEDLSKLSRRASMERLRKAGFKVTTSESGMCELARAYLQSEAARDGTSRGQMYNVARLLDRYLSWCASQPEKLSFQKCVLSKIYPIRFWDLAIKCMSPTTVRNHVAAASGFIDRALVCPILQKHFPPKTYKCALREAATVWTDVRRRAGKAARTAQRVRVASGQLPRIPVTEICFWLVEARNSGALSGCLRLLKAKQDGDSGCLPEHLHAPYEFVVCFLASVLLIHGARLCTATSMTLDEVQGATSCQGYSVVRVTDHKTSRSEGAAVLALRPNQIAVFKDMVRLRAQFPSLGNKVLTTVQGGEPNAAKLFEMLNLYLRKERDEDFAIKFNDARKCIESHKFLTKSHTENDHTSRYLCHGKPTADLHYSFKSDQFAVCGSRDVGLVLSQLIAMDISMTHLPKKPDGKTSDQRLHPVPASRF